MDYQVALGNRRKLNKESSSCAVMQLLFGFALLFPCFASELMVSGAISAALFALYGICMLFRDPTFTAKYLYAFYVAYAAVFGVFACEYGSAYLSELRAYAEYFGSLPLITLAQWLFLAVLYAYDRGSTVSLNNKQKVKLSSRQGKWLKLLLIAGSFLQLLLLARVITHPAFLTGMDRFQYESAYLGGIWTQLQSLLLYVLPVAALYMVNFDKRIPLAFISLYVIYALWTGNKFGIFVMAGYCILLVFFPTLDSLHREKKVNIASKIFGVVLAVLLLMSLSQTITYGQSFQEFLSYLVSRIAQQGQIWWGLYDRVQSSGIHPDEFSSEIASWGNSIFGSVQNYDVGIYKAMQIVNPVDFNAKIATGSRYTEAGFAMSLYYFGIIGPLFYAAVFALAMGLSVNWFIFAASRNWIIESAILFRLFQKLCAARTMFLMDELLSLETMLSLLVLLLVLIIRRSQNGDTKNLKLMINNA